MGGAYGYGRMDVVIPDARSMYGFCRTSGWNVVYSWDFSLVWDARHLTGDGVVSIWDNQLIRQQKLTAPPLFLRAHYRMFTAK